MRPSSSPSTRAPWPPWRIRPGATQSAAQFTRQPTVRGAPIFSAISSSLRPFWSDTIAPSAASRGVRTSSAPDVVLRFDGQEHQAEPVTERAGCDRTHRHRDRTLTALDGEPVRVHRRDVVFRAVDEQDVVTGAGERRAGHAADRAGAIYRDRHRISPKRMAKWSALQAVGAPPPADARL